MQEKIGMDKIRILQFPIANSYGGITHYALGNWKWMDKERFQCDFATMSRKLDFADEILKTGSRVHYISSYAEDNRSQFIKEFNEILEQGYDVVHLHTKQWKSFLVEELCRGSGVSKVIVHSHSTGIDAFDDRKREHELREHERVKEAFNESLATDFWACSASAAEFLFGNSIPAEKIKIMRNAIDLDRFAFRRSVREQYRKAYGLEDAFVIGNVARMAYQKNHKFLLEVFCRVLTELPNAKLLLVGDGELEEKTKRQAEALGIDRNVLFLGKREDVYNLYQAMDLFVLPSLFEGLGITFIEAQASGLPCIGSDRVPQDVNLSENMSLLPLETECWKRKILECVGVERTDNIKELAEAGYDIRRQIKCIEKEYSNIG